jgi:hypothetical protein
MTSALSENRCDKSIGTGWVCVFEKQLCDEIVSLRIVDSADLAHEDAASAAAALFTAFRGDGCVSRRKIRYMHSRLCRLIEFKRGAGDAGEDIL